MTSESEAETVPWIEKKRVEYPYAYDKGGKVSRYFGIRGIPHSILIDPTGVVVWRGHPGTLTDATIESSLKGALTKPLYAWPASARPVVQSLVKGDFAGALAKAAKVPEADGGADIAKEVQSILEGRLAQAEAALSEGNFLGAREQGLALGKGCEGLPELERAKKVVADVDAHPDSKRVLEGQKAVRKLRAKELSKRKELEKALEDLKELATELRGTYAATEAEAFMEQIRERLQR